MNLRKRNRTTGYSLINILGLAIGLTGLILIVLFLNYEYSYDKWSPKLKNVFSLIEFKNSSDENKNNNWSDVSDSRIGFYLRSNLSGIEDVTMIEKNWWAMKSVYR